LRLCLAVFWGPREFLMIFVHIWSDSMWARFETRCLLMRLAVEAARWNEVMVVVGAPYLDVEMQEETNLDLAARLVAH